MKVLKIATLLIVSVLALPVTLLAQEASISLKGRVSGFTGTFGDTYSAIGYEPSVTIKPTAKPWAGGISYSRNLLVFEDHSDMKVDMSLLTFHAGVKGTVAKYFHPFAYALLGLRFASYENEDLPAESDPVFNSLSLSYGARTGLQIGGPKWRFETTIEYLSGTNARYLTPETFRKATQEGRNYRDFTACSPMSAITVGVGVTHVISWADDTID
ncbi:hypothetical protein [Pontibacter burrus]|uniref:Outer membrane protein beta-barrel domain-containing protein n=1 Tax=Pontibacter burrus TaxID=2704466 RepID=A0A6B3LQ66_9BACT|nr:hypothetical protein [Pontibacter burrus]NEM97225.1 hypothetical protein [Pontibacter burrus]